jgi:hypothetical protein
MNCDVLFGFCWVLIVGLEGKERKEKGGWSSSRFCETFVIYFIPWQNATDVSGKPSRPPRGGHRLSTSGWFRVEIERAPKQIQATFGSWH